MAGVEGRALRVRGAVAVVAASLIALSLFLPWVVAGVGQEPTEYSGLRLMPLAIAEILAAMATVALAAAAMALDRPGLARLAALAAVLALVVSAPVILILETVSSTLPTSFLPVTLRRNGLELSAGPGLWLASVSAAVAALALGGLRMRSIEPRLWTVRENRAWALALLALMTLTGLAGWLRYEAWLDASAASHHFALPGWAAPWLGPLSLFAIWMLVVALVLAMLARTEIAGLIAASAGWLLTFLAALAIIAARSIGGLSALAGGEGAPGFEATGAVWAVFLIGLSAATVGGWLVCLRPPVTAPS
jgi:hypothetical protein